MMNEGAALDDLPLSDLGEDDLSMGDMGGELGGGGLPGDDLNLEEPALGGLDDLPSEYPFSDSQKEMDKAIEELQGIPGEAQTEAPPLATAGVADTSELIWDIPVEVGVVLGSAELSVARLMALENGEVVELNRRIGEPLDIVVNGRNIAKGEITMMENDAGRFGIRITQIVGK